MLGGGSSRRGAGFRIWIDIHKRSANWHSVALFTVVLGHDTVECSQDVNCDLVGLNLSDDVVGLYRLSRS